VIRRAARPESHFLMIRNDVVRDARLSYRARGILADILSRPDNWRVNRDQIAAGGTEGVAAIRTALTELETAGYLQRRRIKDENGKFTWESVVFDTPQAKPQVSAIGGFPADGFPADGNPPSVEDSVVDLEEDVLERATPPSSEPPRNEFEDWRSTDRELFQSIVGEEMTSDGSVWKKGTFPADVWYDALRKNKERPMRWPGKFVEQLSLRDGVGEYFGTYGVDPAAA
jgi:hypothetical protein